MTITFTFRHIDPSDAIKSYAEAKISRLQKLLLHPMTARVTLAVEKQRHVAEVQLASGKEHIEAKEASDELYASIDQVVDKLERQIMVNKGGKLARHRRPSGSVRISEAPRAGGPSSATSDDVATDPRRIRGDTPSEADDA
jgi:putative sigma-54 modulation protein